MTSSLAISILGPFIVVLSIFGNVLTIIAVVKTSALRSRYAVRFITSLACCDLSFALLSCPVNFVTTLLEMKEWRSPLCTLNGYLGVFFCLTSLLTLTIVSFDRYVAIVTPFRYHTWMTSRKTKIIIAGKWVFAACVAAVPLSGWGEYIFYPRKGFCFIDYRKDFGCFVFIGVWFQVGLTIIGFSYYHIFKEARRQRRQIQALTVADGTVENSLPKNVNMNLTGQRRAAVPQMKKHCNQLKRIKHENKAALTIFAIIAGFLSCWMPFVLVNLTAALIDCDVPKWMDVVSTLLVAAGSMVNPLFYAWLDYSFRLAFKKLLLPVFGRANSVPTTMTSYFSKKAATLGALS